MILDESVCPVDDDEMMLTMNVADSSRVEARLYSSAEVRSATGLTKELFMMGAQTELDQLYSTGTFVDVRYDEMTNLIQNGYKVFNPPKWFGRLKSWKGIWLGVNSV